MNHGFQNSKAFENRLNPYREITTRIMTQNEHVYAICCRPEEVNDVVSSENVKTMQGSAVINFELLALVISEIFKTRSPPVGETRAA